MGIPMAGKHKTCSLKTAIPYDVVLAGGGLAGLSLAIQLANEGYRVIVLEKDQYPRHRVCGEYISMESWNFLKGLGINLEELKVPVIRQLELSGVDGRSLQLPLPLGGFGISRYTLDHSLAMIAREQGVTVLENAKVNGMSFSNGEFRVETADQTYSSKIACGSFGKRSNLDLRWKRPFAVSEKNKLNNFIGIKYYMQLNFPHDTIALHNFPGGYCGIVQVENGLFNVCYLTTAARLRQFGGNIESMEINALSRNPHLCNIFLKGQKFDSHPLTISQVSFDKKSLVEDHVLMIGDAAGMITPLCGNGMSMALHASKLAAGQISLYLKGSISRKEMEEGYSRAWQRVFGNRLKMGRRIQRLMSHQWMTDLLLATGRIFPGLIRWMIRKTHGQPF